MELMPEMRWAQEMREDSGEAWHAGKPPQRERLVFVNLMGKSLRIKHTVARQEGNQNQTEGQRKAPQTRTDEICLGFVIRHVRLQIKSVISRLINDLANYQRYLKML